MKFLWAACVLPVVLAVPAPAPEAAPEAVAPVVLPREVVQLIEERHIIDEKRQFGFGLPTVTATNAGATVVGTTTSGGVEKFNGIPFAVPPTGTNRLRAPSAPPTPIGKVIATGTPNACPQFVLGGPEQSIANLFVNPIGGALFSSSEDCLTLNIRRPVGTTKNSKLPVLFWIYGGGFELGSASLWDGATLVADAITKGKPVLFVAVSYRVGGFGFLGGKEIKAAGAANLGLLDQRLGMKWVADNIADFGGDPDKVTIWGESAGSISVMDHLVMYGGDNTYKGKKLFRGGIMDSGSIIPTDPVDSAKAQGVYDQVVAAAGCKASSDTLNCLRGLSFEKARSSFSTVPSILSYNSVALSYLPRPDGVALTQSPEISLFTGAYAKVPVIIGDQEDEGTLFCILNGNITTTADIEQYLSSLYFANASKDQIKALVATYPDDPSAGSPFRTGTKNNISPQFKRLAAILGDLTFTLTRRAALQVLTTVTPGVKVWSFLNSSGYGSSFLGTFHAANLNAIFGFGSTDYSSNSFQNYYLNFVYNLDPNDSTGTKASTLYPNWPAWTAATKQLWNPSATSGQFIPDTFRQSSYEFLINNVASLRF